MPKIDLAESTIAQIDELVMRYHKETGQDYSRAEIIDKALIALEEIADQW